MTSSKNGKSVVSIDRREWLRIDDRLPLEYCRIGASVPADPAGTEAEALASLQAFLNRPTHDLLGAFKPDDPQSALVPWMLKMDWVLGVMLGTLARVAPGGLAAPRVTDVNISATGMSFPSKQSYHGGEQLDVRLILPPFIPIRTTAEVVRTTEVPEHPAGRYVVAVTFVDMRADDQDRLIHHILQLQAERLRTRQREAER